MQHARRLFQRLQPYLHCHPTPNWTLKLVLEKRVVTWANMKQPFTDWFLMRLKRRFPERPVNSGLDWKNGGQDLEEELAVSRKYAVFSQSAELV